MPEDRKSGVGVGVGDVWTWTALCADTKLIASWYVGGRESVDAGIFLEDLKGRLLKPRHHPGEGHYTLYSV